MDTNLEMGVTDHNLAQVISFHISHRANVLYNLKQTNNIYIVYQYILFLSLKIEMSLSNRDKMSIGVRPFPPQCIIQIWFRSVQCSLRCPSPNVCCPTVCSDLPYVRSSWMYHDGQEMSGCVFPPRLLPPHRLAIGIESHKHVLLLIAPLRWSVGVVLVLLDAFDQATVGTVVSLRRSKKQCQWEVFKIYQSRDDRWCYMLLNYSSMLMVWTTTGSFIHLGHKGEQSSLVNSLFTNIHTSDFGISLKNNGVWHPQLAIYKHCQSAATDSEYNQCITLMESPWPLGDCEAHLSQSKKNTLISDFLWHHRSTSRRNQGHMLTKWKWNSDCWEFPLCVRDLVIQTCCQQRASWQHVVAHITALVKEKKMIWESNICRFPGRTLRFKRRLLGGNI